MQKAGRYVCAVVSRMIMIGLSIQILLGIFWMCFQFGHFQDLAESLFYIEVSKSFLFDEYTGALYPVLLALARGMEALLPIPYTYFLQTLQLAVAFWTGYVFWKSVGVVNGKYRVFGSLAILTVPMAMQCHLAVLPHSLNLSAVLLELAFVADAVRQEQPLPGKQLVKANACWLVSALLMPDYLYLGAVPVLLLWMYDAWKYRKQKGKGVLWHLLLIAAFAGIIAGTGDLVQEPGCFGRPAKTVDAALFRRLNWGNFEDDWDDWPEDMKESCSFNFTQEITYYPENVELLFQPQLEASVGLERAREIYRELNGKAIRNRFVDMIRLARWDVMGYTVPSAALRMFLSGKGYDSLAGRNYEMMRKEAPLLTRYYVNYSGWWMLAGIALSAVLTVLFAVFSKRKKYRMHIAAGVISVLTGGAMVVWYSMQGACVWDYKNGLLVGALWSAWMVLAAWKGVSRNGTTDTAE